jgi:prolyl-tRNA synthetase
MNIAPYQIALVQIDMKNEEQNKVANDLYEKLTAAGIEVIYDDRDERPGVKFKDMELIGIPARIVVGKKIAENLVEFKERATGNQEEISIDEVVEKITKYVKDSLK